MPEYRFSLTPIFLMILSLYGKIQVRENSYSGIVYAEKDIFKAASACQWSTQNELSSNEIDIKQKSRSSIHKMLVSSPILDLRCVIYEQLFCRKFNSFNFKVATLVLNNLIKWS